MTKQKKRVNPIEVEKSYHFIVTENESKHEVSLIDYDKLVTILQSINEMEFKNLIIPANAIAKQLCKTDQKLNVKMLRPTGRYYQKYHLVLKILDHEGYIEYYKDGSVKKLHKLKDITPTKRGMDEWLP